MRVIYDWMNHGYIIVLIPYPYYTRTHPTAHAFIIPLLPYVHVPPSNRIVIHVVAAQRLLCLRHANRVGVLQIAQVGYVKTQSS